MRVQVEDISIVRFVRTLDGMRLERAARIIQEAIDVSGMSPVCSTTSAILLSHVWSSGSDWQRVAPLEEWAHCTGAKCVFSTALLIRERY